MSSKPQRPSDWVTEKLYQVVNYRHGHLLPTVFTSNLALDALAEHLSPRVAYRIGEMCLRVELTGAQLRTGESAS